MFCLLLRQRTLGDDGDDVVAVLLLFGRLVVVGRHCVGNVAVLVVVVVFLSTVVGFCCCCCSLSGENCLAGRRECSPSSAGAVDLLVQSSVVAGSVSHCRTTSTVVVQCCSILG